MPPTDPRRFPPGKLVQLLNSLGQGQVLTTARLRRHRDEAGAAICATDESGMPDFRSVHLLRYAAWLLRRRHAKPSPPAESDPSPATGPTAPSIKPPRKRGPTFTAIPPRFT